MNTKSKIFNQFMSDAFNACNDKRYPSVDMIINGRRYSADDLFVVWKEIDIMLLAERGVSSDEIRRIHG